VIQFPKPYRFSEGADACPVEVVGNVLEMKIASAEMALAFVVDTLFDDITNAGFKLHDERLTELAIANIRAIMYQHFGLEHPLITFVDRYVDEVDEMLVNQHPLMSVEDLIDDE
jgi:hypothetical protein